MREKERNNNQSTAASRGARAAVRNKGLQKKRKNVEDMVAEGRVERNGQETWGRQRNKEPGKDRNHPG